MTTLLLTDCNSPDQAYAAAAAMRFFREVHLRVTSWREICDILEGSAFDYEKVLILGASLLYDCTRAAMALNELREVGCKVHYYTDDENFFTPPPLNLLMKVHCNPHSLTNAFLDHSGLDANDLRFGNPDRARHYAQVSEFVATAVWQLHELHDAKPYQQVVEALSQDGDPANWSLALQEMHRHWLHHAPQPLAGNSAAWTQLRQQLDELLPIWWQDGHAATPILLRGEPGTPLRDLAAMLQCPELHDLPCRTVAASQFHQVISQANGTALLLEEIDALPLELQTTLLTLLETGRLILDRGPRNFTVRVIATTHQDLTTLVEQGQFLPELAQRLTACELVFPPLGERLDDLQCIAAELCRRRSISLPTGAIEVLQDYPFPGNEAELGTLLERASLTTPEEFRNYVHELRNSAASALSTTPFVAGQPETLEGAMRRHVSAVVQQCGGNKSQAAQRLGITRTTLRKYL